MQWDASICETVSRRRAFGGLYVPSFGHFSHYRASPTAPPGTQDNLLPGFAYDPNCDPATTADCKAKVIISAERLVSLEAGVGHAEHTKIGRLLEETPGVRDELLGEPGWDCLYDMMIGDN